MMGTRFRIRRPRWLHAACCAARSATALAIIMAAWAQAVPLAATSAATTTPATTKVIGAPATTGLPAHGAGGAATGAEVTDIGAFWHFTRIAGLYRVDGRVLVCVRKADGRWDFWDPKRDVLLGTKNIDCLPPVGSRSFDPTVVSGRIAGAAMNVETDASFADAKNVSWHLEDLLRCPPAFGRVYTVEAPGSEPYGFFVLERLRHPREVDLRDNACGLVPGMSTLRYTQRYDSVGSLQALDLGDHRTLLMTRTGDGDPVAIVVHDRPRHAWSNGQGVYLVPAPLLQPALDRAGPDFTARERAVAQVLDGVR
jgi:hypothetical protein